MVSYTAYQSHVQSIKWGEIMLTTDERYHLTSLLDMSKSMLWKTTRIQEEAATPEVRDTLLRQYNEWVYVHDMIFRTMQRFGLYPAQHIEALIQTDIKHAQDVLKMPLGAKQQEEQK